MKKYYNNETGVSLIEILAAIILLSIIFLSFFTFFTQSAKYTQHNKGKLTAVDIGEEVVSEIRHIQSPDELLIMGFLKNGDQYTDEVSYPNHIVEIDVIGDSVAIDLKVLKVTVRSTASNSIKGSSFVTEMYIDQGGIHE